MITETLTNADPALLNAKEIALLELGYNGVIASTCLPSVILGTGVPYTIYIENNALGVGVERSFTDSLVNYVDTNTIKVSFVRGSNDSQGFPLDLDIKIFQFFDEYFTAEGLQTIVVNEGCYVDSNRIANYSMNRKNRRTNFILSFYIYFDLDPTIIPQVIDVNNEYYLINEPPTSSLKAIGIKGSKNTILNFFKNKAVEKFELDDLRTDEDLTLYNSITAKYQTLLNSEEWIKYARPPR